MIFLSDFSENSEYARRKGAKDKKKRKNRARNLALGAAGIGLAGAGLYFGGKKLLGLKRKARLSKPLGKGADVADPKDNLGFQFSSEVKKRTAKAEEQRRKKIQDFWNNNQTQNRHDQPPRAKYDLGADGKFDRFKNGPLAAAIGVGGLMGAVSKTRSKDKAQTPKTQYARLLRNDVSVGATLGTTLGAYVGLVGGKNIVPLAVKGAGLGAAYGVSKGLVQATRNTSINKLSKKSNKKKK